MTHPVPLLFLLLVVGVDLAGRFAVGTWHRSEIILGLLAASSLGYIYPFIDKSHSLSESAYEPLENPGVAALLLRWMTFATGGIGMALFRALIAALLLGSLWIAGKHLRLYWSNASPAAVCALVLLVTVPFLPDNMNGSEFFSRRLYVLVWLCALAAASGFRSPVARTRKALLAPE